MQHGTIMRQVLFDNTGLLEQAQPEAKQPFVTSDLTALQFQQALTCRVSFGSAA